MKKLLKILFIAVFAFLIGIIGLDTSRVYALEPAPSQQYRLSCTQNELLLTKGEVEIKRTSSIRDILREIESGSTLQLDNVTLNESLVFSSADITLSGTLLLKDGASIIIDGIELTMRELSLTLTGGTVRVKQGSLNMYSGDIRSDNAAVTLDFSASSYFSMYGGAIYSSADTALSLLRGTTRIYSGRIECEGASAIYNTSSLTLLSSPIIKGESYDIITSSEITLSSNDLDYEGRTRVKFLREFPEGNATAAFYAKNEESLSGITLYDKNDTQMQLKHYKCGALFDESVIAVYRPYVISLKYKDSLLESVDYINGDTFSLPTPDGQLGYSFVGWYTIDGERFDTEGALKSSITLYAKYKLTDPAFNLFYEDFTYDGEERNIRIENITHPLLEYGFLSFEWYKDGEKLSSYSHTHRVKNVADSGEYSVTISLTVGQDTTRVSTPPFSLNIKKATVFPPTIPEKSYTGMPIIPEILENGIYTAEKITPTLAGVYPIKLTLCDYDNYSFYGTDKNFFYVDFHIKRAENEWISAPEIKDIYTIDAPAPRAISRFGEVNFLYASAGNGIFSDTVPNEAGEYLMRAVVLGNDNYTSLEYEPIPFKIIEEIAVGISVKALPDLVEYVAFQRFDPKGIVVEVSYNSGRYETLSEDVLGFEYQKGDTFLYGDSGITVKYLTTSVMLPVTVLRADYDMSGVSFADKSFVYDGLSRSIDIPSSLPVGLDGIPLRARVVGGGADVGKYTVYLHFSTESESYNLPESLSATLTITPLMCEAVWDSLEFVYDKGIKVPRAFFLDIHKRKVPLTVEGGRSLAGKYIATAVYNGVNYEIVNKTVEFEIKKAEYDMSGATWRGGNFTYDGELKGVYIESLPSGVEVIGYINNEATDAGEYIAIPIFSYDEDNYNKPSMCEYPWQIAKREYIITDFSFSDNEATYDGQYHYPLLNGMMPTGIDNIPLKYSFSMGVMRVGEGRVRVEIVFSTDSRNYIVPEAQYAYVTILPREIYVVWEGGELVYNGTPQAPRATAKEASVSLTGYGVNAGEYKAVATSDNSDYKIINNTFDFTIKKADNAFTRGPFAIDIFYGREPSITAECRAGEIKVEYYLDKDLQEMVTGVPRAVGSYYLVISTEGDNNHLPISSPILSFKIIAVVPTTLGAKLNKDTLIALDKLRPDDISLTLGFNDGTEKALSLSDVRVKYEGGDTLRYGDKNVEIFYEGLSCALDVTVVRREYDLTNILWQNTTQIYDGTAKSVYLSGLPDGLIVTEYIGNSWVNAGEYTVSVRVEYDKDNYNEPKIPDATLIISKQVVELPNIKSVVYNGESQMPSVSNNPLYTYNFELKPTGAGAYPIKFTLRDKDNYTFPGDKGEVSVDYVIEKRVLNITVGSVVLYLFEGSYEESFTLDSGTLLEGDTLIPSYYESDGKLYVSFLGLDNYDIRVTPGNIERVNRLSRTMSLLFLVAITLLIVLLLLAYVLIKKRSYSYISSRGSLMALPSLNEDNLLELDIDQIAPEISEPPVEIPAPMPPEMPSAPEEMPAIAPEEIPTNAPEELPTNPIPEAPREPSNTQGEDEPIPPEEIPVEENGGSATSVLCDDEEPIPPEEITIDEESADRIVRGAVAISAEYANEAITNSTAKDLLRRDEVIVTEGNRRGIINVDTLSRSFSAGDRVDINILKEHRLIPYDTSYIKVLARGIIDKPLTVYANDFSLSAIKMIVLSGGKAVRANTYSISKNGRSS